MAGDTWAPVVTLNRFGFVVSTVVSQQLGREQSWEGHGALPHNREQCRKVGKKRLPVVRPVQLWFEPLA